MRPEDREQDSSGSYTIWEGFGHTSEEGPALNGQSKAVRAHRWVRAHIDSGHFAPGARLVLDQIARELGISPVPVREALRMLEAEGLVEFERNIGARVRMANAIEYEHAMQTLAIVEGAATGLSAGSLTAVDLRRARTANEKLRRCLEDFDPLAFTRLNHEFHEALFCRCANADLLELVVRGWQRLQLLRQSTFSFVPERAVQSVDEHDHLLRLVESQAEPLEIEVASREHRLNTLRAMHEYQRESVVRSR